MTSNFYNDIKDTLGKKIEVSGFKLIKPFDSKGIECVFVKRYSNDIALYIKCYDNRSKGGDVSISLWIAPIQFPDDRIEVLNIGVKIVIFSDYNVSDELMFSVGNKINELVYNISSLIKIVEKDIEQPFIPNKSVKWYYYSREIYSIILNTKETKDYFEKLRNVAQKCISGKISYKKFETECTSFINSLGDGFFSGEISSLEPNEMGELLAESLYSQELFT